MYSYQHSRSWNLKFCSALSLENLELAGTPVDLYLISENQFGKINSEKSIWKNQLGKINWEKSSWMNWIFSLFWTGFLMHVFINDFKIDFCRLKIQFVELNFSKFKYRGSIFFWKAAWFFTIVCHFLQMCGKNQFSQISCMVDINNPDEI